MAQPGSVAEPGQPAGQVRFGVFEIDLRSGELRKQGMRVRLQIQPYRVLQMLLEYPGQVVTREELRQRLWADGTFVDFEHGLNAAVKRLRRALGDDADNPRFVETLPRRGYRFIAPVTNGGAVAGRGEAAEATTSGGVVGAGRPGKVRLLVLPFAGLTQGSELEYFVDGLTEEVIAQLGHLHANRIGVIARTTAMRFRKTTKTARELGVELGVDYLMEGSVRCMGDSGRITAQLIDTSDETHLWAESYEVKCSESSEGQVTLARRIADAMAAELLRDRGAGSLSEGTAACEANRAYLKCLYHRGKDGVESCEKAIGYAEEAVRLDPNFARAHAALGRARIKYAALGLEAPRGLLEQARESARRAVKLDANLGEAHLVTANVARYLEWDWGEADEGYRRAIALNPNCEESHIRYAGLLATLGRTRESLEEAEAAFELDPLCLDIATWASWVYYAAGDLAEVIACCRHSLELNPNYVPARRLLAAAYLEDGRAADAVEQLETAAEMGGQDLKTRAWLGYALAASGREGKAREILAEMEAVRAGRYVSPMDVALVHAGLRDVEACVGALELAVEECANGVTSMGIRPPFRFLHSDERFGRLLERLRLYKPPYEYPR